MFLILILSLVLGYTSAARSMAATKTTKMNSKEKKTSGIFSEPISRNYNEKKKFVKSKWFQMLPKGVPIPPSEPSPRHNDYMIDYYPFNDYVIDYYP